MALTDSRRWVFFYVLFYVTNITRCLVINQHFFLCILVSLYPCIFISLYLSILVSKYLSILGYLQSILI
ncbi:hypothetical protein C1S45_12395 [Lactiplantibacillus plantarum]|nr:hypothetical protein [Lactiplantibacillus plantarum]MDE4476898.1 hypothetical protein [Lactiplantibacillus plantarum]MDE4495366.1 hypothetical protein [Lactiplantibacillus plantarum]